MEPPPEQRGRTVTSRDLARLAGVSQATVSRVLNGTAQVSPDLRERVMWALEETGYRPNALAQAMKTGRTGTVGVVIARVTNPFYPELLEVMGRELASVDHRMILWETTSAGEDSAVEAIQQGLVDGVVFTTALPGSRAVDAALRRRAPMVLVNRTLEDADCDQVSSDNAAGGGLVGQYLRDHGHRHIGFIGGPSFASTARDRRDGLRRALAGSAAGLDGLVEAEGDFSHDTGHALATRMLATSGRPTAMVGANDTTAFGILNAAAALGIAVPDDLWVVGYDDVAMAAWERIDLTTVRQPSDEIARLGVRWLLERIGGAAEPSRRHRFPCHLQVRGSTGHAPPSSSSAR